MNITCIIPSLNRPIQLRRCIDGFFATTSNHNAECVAVLDGEVDDRFKVLWGSRAMLVYNRAILGAIASWNIGAKSVPETDIFIAGADDLIWGDGWLDAAFAALEALPGKQGMVGFNDLDRSDKMATHFLLTRQCAIEVMGGVLAIPAYHHYWSDPEMNARATRAGCYTWCAEAFVEHRSFMNDKALIDDTYQEAARWFKQDEETFNRRKAMGFPNDFEPVLR
jgi:GT2 family glycosyltransferase